MSFHPSFFLLEFCLRQPAPNAADRPVPIIHDCLHASKDNSMQVRLRPGRRLLVLPLRAECVTAKP
jgi:hypothetical protein